MKHNLLSHIFLQLLIFISAKLDIFSSTKIRLIVKDNTYQLVNEVLAMMLFKLLAQFILTVALCGLNIHLEIPLYRIRSNFKEFPM